MQLIAHLQGSAALPVVESAPAHGEVTGTSVEGPTAALTLETLLVRRQPPGGSLEFESVRELALRLLDFYKQELGDNRCLWGLHPSLELSAGSGISLSFVPSPLAGTTSLQVGVSFVLHCFWKPDAG
jgi:hypothetical protein